MQSLQSIVKTQKLSLSPKIPQKDHNLLQISNQMLLRRRRSHDTLLIFAKELHPQQFRPVNAHFQNEKHNRQTDTN